MAIPTGNVGQHMSRGPLTRRYFVSCLGGAAAAWPLAARAQQPMPVIGFLHGASPEGYAPMVTAFRQGLKEAGYVEGKNVAVEYRWAEGHYDRLPALAAELVRRQVATIVTGGTPPAIAAKAATSTIPIVFNVGIDPVQAGLVASLNRPGGNVTGLALLTVELAAKRVQLLHELLPTATLIAVLVNPTTPLTEPETRGVRDAARSLGLQLHVLNASTESELSSCAPARSSSASTYFSITSALKSWRWRPATRCPQFTECASLLPPAA
jgi:putative ABC transport system substrate-binding protein